MLAGLCLALPFVGASAADSVADAARLKVLLESIAKGQSRLLPQDEQLLAKHPSEAVRAILKGWGGVDPGMFPYVLRDIQGALSPTDAEKVIVALLPLAEQGNYAAIDALSTFRDPRVLTALHDAALNPRLEDGTRARAVEAYAGQALRYDSRYQLDKDVAERERPFFERLAVEPSMAGRAAARYLKNVYHDESFERRIEAMKDAKYGSVARAASALRDGKPWEKQKAVPELAGYGVEGLPALLDVYSTSTDAMVQESCYRAIREILDSDSNRNEQSLGEVLAAMRRAGKRKREVASLIEQFTDRPEGQNVWASLASDPELRAEVIERMEKPWAKRFDDKLSGFLSDPDIVVRAAAARALSLHGDPAGRTALGAILQGTAVPPEHPKSAAEQKDSAALFLAIDAFGAVGTTADVPLLERFEAARSSATRPTLLSVHAAEAVLGIKNRSFTDKTEKTRWLEGEWEATCNQQVSVQLDSLLQDRQMAEFCLDVLKRGTAQKCALDKARDYLYVHGWIAKGDRWKAAKDLTLNDRAVNDEGPASWFWNLLKHYGPPPPSQ